MTEQITQELVNQYFDEGKAEWDRRVNGSGLTEKMFIAVNDLGWPVQFLAEYQMSKEDIERRGFTMPVLVEGIDIKLSDVDNEAGADVAIRENDDDEPIEFSAMVSKLVKPGQQIVDEMTASDAHTLHMAVGISGESGELLDAVKKAVIYRNQIDIENVVEELGDIEFYLEGFRQGLGITREETIDANIHKLGKRYKGHNYSDQQAQDRADKDFSC